MRAAIQLSRRQQQVIELLAADLKNHEIAKEGSALKLSGTTSGTSSPRLEREIGSNSPVV